MGDFAFWNKWSTKDRWLSRFALLLFVASIVFFLFAYGQDAGFVIDWEVIAQRETFRYPADYINAGPFQIPINLKHFVLYEQFNGSEVVILPWISYLLLATSYLFFCFGLSFVTTLKRFWFIFGMALAALFVIGYQMELLMVFGRYDKVFTIGVLVAYFIAAFLFNAFWSHVAFYIRFLTFLIITGIAGLAINSFATIETPFLYLAAYGMWAPVVISLLFIVLVAHEIPAFFISVISSTSTFKGINSIKHYVFISLIYIVNLILVFMHQLGTLNWQGVGYNSMVLLVLSSVVGIWGFKNRSTQYESIFEFKTLGFWLYTGLAVVTFVTLACFAATANDPVIKSFERTIWYFHLGYGVIFFAYVIANFFGPLGQGMSIAKILYQPKYMPYFTYQFMGAIACFAAFASTNWQTPFYEIISGYNIGLGDLYKHNNNLLLSQEYYKESAVYSHFNHRSNYSLASLARAYGDEKTEAQYYYEANLNRPSPYAFSNLAGLYVENGQVYEAIFTLEEGIKVFPKVGALKNNLSVLMAKEGALDSALIYTYFAKGQTQKSPLFTNIIGLNARYMEYVSADSIFEAYHVPGYTSNQSNAYALYSKMGKALQGSKKPQDSVLNLLTSTLLYEQSLNQVFEGDFETNQLGSYLKHPSNAVFKGELMLAEVWLDYCNGHIGRAIHGLELLAQLDYVNGPEYHSMAGMMALKFKNYKTALHFFQMANYQSPGHSLLPLAMAQLELEPQKGDSVLAVLMQIGKLDEKKIASDLLAARKIMTAKDLKTDFEKFTFYNYNAAFGLANFPSVVEATFENDSYLQLLLVNFWKRSWAKGTIAKDVKVIATWPELNPTLMSELDLLLQDYSLLEMDSAQTVAMASEKNGATPSDFATVIKTLGSGYVGDTIRFDSIQSIVRDNPFKEEYILALANYWRKDSPIEAYSMLQEALEVNKFSPELLKAYMKVCVELEFFDYLENPLERFRREVEPQEYMEFEQELESLQKVEFFE